MVVAEGHDSRRGCLEEEVRLLMSLAGGAAGAACEVLQNAIVQMYLLTPPLSFEAGMMVGSEEI